MIKACKEEESEESEENQNETNTKNTKKEKNILDNKNIEQNNQIIKEKEIMSDMQENGGDEIEKVRNENENQTKMVKISKGPCQPCNCYLF